MSKSTASKTDTLRRAMVGTAARWLPQRGMAAVNLIEVARAVGAPRGSIYHYFPQGRDQLLSEAMSLASFSGLRMIQKAASDAKSVDSFIQTIFDTSVMQIGGKDFSGGCPVGAAVMSAEVESAAIQAEFQAAFAAWDTALCTAFMALGIPTKKQARELANCVLIAYEGALVCAKGARNPMMFISAARMVKAIAASMLVRL